MKIVLVKKKRLLFLCFTILLIIIILACFFLFSNKIIKDKEHDLPFIPTASSYSFSELYQEFRSNNNMILTPEKKNKITNIYEQKEKIDQMKEHAYSFSYEKHIKAYIDLYHELLSAE